LPSSPSADGSAGAFLGEPPQAYETPRAARGVGVTGPPPPSARPSVLSSAFRRPPGASCSSNRSASERPVLHLFFTLRVKKMFGHRRNVHREASFGNSAPRRFGIIRPGHRHHGSTPPGRLDHPGKAPGPGGFVRVPRRTLGKVFGAAGPGIETLRVSSH